MDERDRGTVGSAALESVSRGSAHCDQHAVADVHTHRPREREAPEDAGAIAPSTTTSRPIVDRDARNRHHSATPESGAARLPDQPPSERGAVITLALAGID
jgi:hypothetical protein